MKQFVITIPNPIRGKGAKGFDRRPQEGEPTFSVFHCYADNEKRAREITASSLDMRKVPDGTKLVEIAYDPRVKNESFTSVIFQGEEKKEPMQHPVPASSIKRYEVTSDTEIRYTMRRVYNVYAQSAQEAVDLAKTSWIAPLDEYAINEHEDKPDFMVSEIISDER
jgi:hypothetical protein